MDLRYSLPLLALLAASCAGPEGDTPSLASRPIEGILDEPVRAIAPIESADDPALASQIDTLVQAAIAGDTNFDTALPSARNAVSAALGSARESERWIAAQLAVSALDAARSETVRALTALDSIMADQTVNGRPAESDRLFAARERVAGLYAEQATAFDELRARLGE